MPPPGGGFGPRRPAVGSPSWELVRGKLRMKAGGNRTAKQFTRTWEGSLATSSQILNWQTAKKLEKVGAEVEVDGEGGKLKVSWCRAPASEDGRISSLGGWTPRVLADGPHSIPPKRHCLDSFKQRGNSPLCANAKVYVSIHDFNSNV